MTIYVVNRIDTYVNPDGSEYIEIDDDIGVYGRRHFASQHLAEVYLEEIINENPSFEGSLMVMPIDVETEREHVVYVDADGNTSIGGLKRHHAFKEQQKD